MTNETAQPTNVGSNDRLGLVARLRQERRPAAWTRGVDTDYPTAWEPNLLAHEAAQEIERLLADVERLTVLAEDYRRRWEAERRAVEATISGGRYPDGTPAW